MSTKTNLKTLLFVLVIASLVLAACATPQQTVAPTEAQPVVVEPTTAPEVVEPTKPPEVQPTTAPEVQPTEVAKKVATFIWTQEFDSLNPYYTNMWFSTITQQLWNCWVWNFDDKSNPIPVLVTEIPSKENGGISEDNKTITLKLRDDIVWSDGTPITAKDFLFTHEMLVNLKNAVVRTNPYDLMESVTAPDDRTVVITFKDPYAPWLARLYQGVLPEHVLRPVFEKDGNIDQAEWNRAPTVGCGPYNFAEWESGSFARFVRNDNYWGNKPKIDEIFFRFVPDDASQIAALTNKEGDLGTFIAYSDIAGLEAAGMKIEKVFSGYVEGIYFMEQPNLGSPAVKDVLVRQAIAYATNREAVTKDLLLGLTQVGITYWDNTPYEDPTLKPYPFDPEKAKQLLDQAGWKDTNNDGVREKDGKDLVLNYGTTTREIRKDTQAVFQQNLADVGIKVNLLNYDSDQFFADYANKGPEYTGELDMFEYSQTAFFPDPDASEWLCSEVPSPEKPTGVNAVGCIPELDKLFQLQATQVDPAERTKTFYQITRYIVDNMHFLGVWQDPDIWAVSSRVQNVKLSGTTPFYTIAEWDLGE